MAEYVLRSRRVLTPDGVTLIVPTGDTTDEAGTPTIVGGQSTIIVPVAETTDEAGLVVFLTGDFVDVLYRVKFLGRAYSRPEVVR